MLNIATPRTLLLNGNRMLNIANFRARILNIEFLRSRILNIDLSVMINIRCGDLNKSKLAQLRKLSVETDTNQFYATKFFNFCLWLLPVCWKGVKSVCKMQRIACVDL